MTLKVAFSMKCSTQFLLYFFPTVPNDLSVKENLTVACAEAEPRAQQIGRCC